MKITVLETLQLGEFPNLCLVRLHTDEGLVGLGETFFGASEVATYLHETAAPRLLGQDPTAIDGLRVRLQNYVGTRSTGVEGRGNSAVDLALWDLAGRATGRPVHQLLGGAVAGGDPRLQHLRRLPLRASGEARRAAELGSRRRRAARTRTWTPGSTAARGSWRGACSTRASPG